VLVEDSTDDEHVNALEVETANLRLVRTMAERLSHEVGNALVPLSTHQQLLGKKKGDPEFLQSLQTALDEGVRRVARLSSQMLFLSRDRPARADAFPLEPLVQEAFREAQRHQPGSKATLVYDKASPEALLHGDRASLKHAFYELILNALQASPKDGKVTVRASVRQDERGQSWVDVEIRDSGPGFAAQVAEHAAEPFFTTRNVGLGLGLTVSRRILETHRGCLEIVPPAEQQKGLVRVCLPLGQPQELPNLN
jgi:signal transduction histidine kinase